MFIIIYSSIGLFILFTIILENYSSNTDENFFIIALFIFAVVLTIFIVFYTNRFLIGEYSESINDYKRKNEKIIYEIELYERPIRGGRTGAGKLFLLDHRFIFIPTIKSMTSKKKSIIIAQYSEITKVSSNEPNSVIFHFEDQNLRFITSIEKKTQLINMLKKVEIIKR